MIRINMAMNTASNQAGYETPAWFRAMFDHAIDEFCRDYQVGKGDAVEYIFKQSPDLKSRRLAEVLRTYKGVDSTDYHVNGLPSWGVLLHEDDPVVVEYKLKHG